LYSISFDSIIALGSYLEGTLATDDADDADDADDDDDELRVDGDCEGASERVINTFGDGDSEGDSEGDSVGESRDTGVLADGAGP